MRITSVRFPVFPDGLSPCAKGWSLCVLWTLPLSSVCNFVLAVTLQTIHLPLRYHWPESRPPFKTIATGRRSKWVFYTASYEQSHFSRHVSCSIAGKRHIGGLRVTCRTLQASSVKNTDIRGANKRRQNSFTVYDFRQLITLEHKVTRLTKSIIMTRFNKTIP